MSRSVNEAAAEWQSAGQIAASVRDGSVRAIDVTEAAIAWVAALNPAINAFTEVTAERALTQARKIDDDRALGKDIGVFAGVPFAAKNLFDIDGVVTLAGSKINRENSTAKRDAVLVERLSSAGAVLIGALNMGEFAYDFTGENIHYGACRNPHDTGRMTGGSSSGSGAATAAGMAPLSLGSDTNGSLRVPASFCGVFSLKPTYGRLPRSGSFPFVDSLDHVGPLARSVEDLATAYDVLQGADAGDHACSAGYVEPTLPTLPQGVDELRVGIACGWFASEAGLQAREAVERVTESLARMTSVRPVMIDEAKAGRAAAYLITNAESSAFHLERLRARAGDFDPDTRDRFLAGALLPAAWIEKAQRVRAWWLAKLMRAFADVDILIVPATPFSAPEIGQKTMESDGRMIALRPNIGLMAQPFSAVGFPVVTVPVFEPGTLPIGVQVIAAPWREDLALRVAAYLQNEADCRSHPPALIRDVA